MADAAGIIHCAPVASLLPHLCCFNDDLLKEMSSQFYPVRKPSCFYALILVAGGAAGANQMIMAIAWGRRSMWPSCVRGMDSLVWQFL